jgi:hypothetical protein
MYNLKKSLPVLLLAFALAPVAQAEPLPTSPMSRDTGVGFEIADQGNRALQEIRADLLRSVRAMRPTLPARPVATSVTLLPATGIAMVATSGPRCAK